MHDAKEIKARLLGNLEGFLAYLLPAGKVIGHEFRVGDVHGAAGKSLSVQLRGEAAGVWQDYGGAADDKGDIFDLFCKNRNVGFKDAFPQICRWLGITDVDRPKPVVKPKPDFKADLTGMQGTPAYKYLTDRGIFPETMKAYKLRNHRRQSQHNTDFIAFQFWDTEGDAVMLKSTGIKPRPDGSKDIWTTPPFYTLWGWWLVREKDRAIIITEGECYRGDTEVLTPTGWQSLEKIDPKTPVLQVHDNGTGAFVQPSRKIVSEFSGELENWSSSQVDLSVTPGHKMIVYERDGTEKQIPASAVRRQFTINKTAPVDGPGIDLTDAQIRFALAVSADAKLLPNDWLGLASLRQRRLILDELVYWDGNHVQNRKQTEYSSKLLKNASWVQTMAVTSGISATIIQRTNKFGSWFKVSLLHSKKTASLTNGIHTKTAYTGKVYCVTVPSGRLLVRRNLKISVCGNCDAMTVFQLQDAHLNATGDWLPVLSMPSGASNLTWIENDYHALLRFERIYINTDMDTKGQAAAQEIAKRLGLARCFRLSVPNFKDANECLMKGEPEDCEIANWFARATTYDPPSLRGAASYSDAARRRLLRWQEEDAKPTFFLPDVSFNFRRGECTLLTGVSGHGKSEIMYQSLLHDMRNGEKVLMTSFEIDPDEMMLNMIQQHLGRPAKPADLDKAMNWFDGKLWFYHPKEDAIKVTTRPMFDDFSYAVRRFGVTKLAIDSLLFVTKKDDYEGQDLFCKTIRDFDRINDTHTLLVAHASPKKDENAVPRLADIQGSSGIIAPFSNVLIVWRNVEKEDKVAKAKEDGDQPELDKLMRTHDGILFIPKQRHTGKRSKTKLWFSPESRSFRTIPDLPPKSETPTMF